MILTNQIKKIAGVIAAIVFIATMGFKLIIIYKNGGSIHYVAPPFYMMIIIDIIVSILAGVAIAIEVKKISKMGVIEIIAIIIQAFSIVEIFVYMSNYVRLPFGIMAGVLLALAAIQLIKREKLLAIAYCLWGICIGIIILYVPMILISY